MPQVPIQFIDAFVQNNAPYSIVDTSSGGTRKVYEPEAYSESFMIRSDATGQLCRYLVKTEKGLQSLYGYYGVRYSTKSPATSFLRVLSGLSVGELKELSATIFSERFNTLHDALEYLATFKTGQAMRQHPEKWALANAYLDQIVNILIS